jgi:hypothetical protein
MVEVSARGTVLTMQNGMLREISELRKVAERIYGSSDTVDHTEGIFQAIGKILMPCDLFRS